MNMLSWKVDAKTVVVPILVVFFLLIPQFPAQSQIEGANPPDEPVKLVFIHHSCGENWLADGHGNLGRTLSEQNYFVSDTNYGWGPGSIGDRTDILDWPEWFLGENRDQILLALYTESGQNSSFTRTISDPGGENTIIMFKSCFPNSALQGSPADPPSDEDWLTVGSAKRVYNRLLDYFVTRPDKLFVVVTAPPLQEYTYSANARAFNTWLVEDWLEENNYPYPNVAVWDFYNVLTDPDNHHRYLNGTVEYHTSAGGDVLYYPDNGDTHPSPAGNRKATSEFVQMLNYFYNNWHSGVPVSIDPEADAEVLPAPQNQHSAAREHSGWISSFEADASNGLLEWEAFFDPSADSLLTCGIDDTVSHEGLRSLLIQYDIGPQGWGTCGLMVPVAQDWSSSEGVSFAAASQPDVVVNLDVYTGFEESRASYVYRLALSDGGPARWSEITVDWDQLTRVEWEPDDTPFDPSRISGIAFGVERLDGERIQGQLWIDEVRLDAAVGMDGAAIDGVPTPAGFAVDHEAPPASQPGEEGLDQASRSLCPLSLGLILLIGLGACGFWFLRL